MVKYLNGRTDTINYGGYDSSKFSENVNTLCNIYNTIPLFREMIVEYYPKWQETWMENKERMEKQYKDILDTFDRIVPKMGLCQFLYYCCPADFINWMCKKMSL